MSSTKNKIALKKLKELNTIWHPESTLVFKSTTDKVVIGRYEDGSLISLDEKALKLCEKWKFKYDKELVDENDEEEEEEEEEEEDEETEEVNTDSNEDKKEEIVDKEEVKNETSSEEEVEEVEGTRKNQILTGKDLENAIDAALDRRDFEEVARLSKMMKESFSFDYAVIDDIEEAFRQYLKIFK